jgi:hypothetical protein
MGETTFSTSPLVNQHLQSCCCHAKKKYFKKKEKEKVENLKDFFVLLPSLIIGSLFPLDY